MFGDSILADPVTQPVAKDSVQLAKLSVWLPPGNWIEWDSGVSFHGPVTVERGFSISQIPLFVKAGSIIPMQPAMRYTGEKPVNPLILAVFPLQDGKASSYCLYEDAGNTSAYQHGEATWTQIGATLSADDTELTLKVDPAEGHYKGMRTERAYEVRLPVSWPPSSVSVNGESVAYSRKKGAPGWRFEGDSLTTVITTRTFSVAQSVTVQVRIRPEMARNRAMLGGFAGKMTRLREAYTMYPERLAMAEGLWSPDPLIDAPMQAGDRMGYHPETAWAEVSALPAETCQVLATRSLTQCTPRRIRPAFAPEYQSENHPGPSLAEYNRLVDVALSHLRDIIKIQPPR